MQRRTEALIRAIWSKHSPVALAPVLILGLLAFGPLACGDSEQAGTVAEQSVQDVRTAPSSSGSDAAIGDAFGTGSVGMATSSGIASARGPNRSAPRLEQAEVPPPPPMPAAQPSGQTSANPPQSGASIVPPMLIRTGNAVIEVDSLEIAISEVRLLAQRMGGSIANTSMQTGQGQIRSATLEVKIPAARFDEAVGGLTPLGKVEAVNEHSEDVGEEFVDITARMTNAKRLEERLITLLATRTGKLEDVLAVERELARVREEIERYEGRIRYLRTRAAISTLSVTVHEPRPLVGNNPGRSILGEAFRNAWRNFVRFIAGLIEAMGVLIPLAAIGVIGWLLWRRFAPTMPPKRPPTA